MGRISRIRIHSEASRQEKGQNLLEFALLSFLLLLIILGIIGFSLIFGAQLSLNLAVNTAARTAAVQAWNLADPATNYDLPIYDELVGSLIILSPTNIQSITIYRADPNGGGMTADKNILNAAGSRTYEAYLPEERIRGTFIGVQVVYRQAVIVPIISSIIGQQLDLTRSATFQIQ